MYNWYNSVLSTIYKLGPIELPCTLVFLDLLTNTGTYVAMSMYTYFGALHAYTTLKPMIDIVR